MSYLRLDNNQFSTNTMMTADGHLRYGTNDGASWGHQFVTPLRYGVPEQGLSNQFTPQRYSVPAQVHVNHIPPQRYNVPVKSHDTPQRYSIPEQEPVTAQKDEEHRNLDIRGITSLMKYIGYPDITDTRKGGIAIWSSGTLKSRGYKFLHRVEIIDESVPSLQPTKHFSNIYIWVNTVLSEGMIDNVNRISSDIFYDRGKELMIVRSNSLDTAVAQAALILLYSKGKLTYYEIVNNNMLEIYFNGVSKSKARKAIYTVLSNLSKH